MPFNPVAAFQGARQNALGIQAQEQGIAREAAAAPRRNALADLQLSQAQTGAERGQTQFDQGQAIQKATILNQSARALKGLAPEQRSAAFQRIAPKLQEFGIDPSQFAGSQFSDQELDSAIAETQGFLAKPTNLSSSQRERSDLIRDVTPALNDQGQIDVGKLDAKSRSAAMALGLIAKSGTVTGQERIATTEGLTEDVAESEEAISKGKETGKLKAQKLLLPEIRGAIKQAEKEAVARGETFTALNRAKAALPGLKEVTEKLKGLADIATFTAGGKFLNEAAKQFGFGATKGATARTTMRAVVDNQVLPLLRDTFGAAFTKAEGDSLRNTLLDPDTAPDQMKATLDAFIEQKVRNIETSERELGVSLPEGMTDNGDGTFTLPDGRIVERE